jgi:hypothetical protein
MTIVGHPAVHVTGARVPGIGNTRWDNKYHDGFGWYRCVCGVRLVTSRTRYTGDYLLDAVSLHSQNSIARHCSLSRLEGGRVRAGNQIVSVGEVFDRWGIRDVFIIPDLAGDRNRVRSSIDLGLTTMYRDSVVLDMADGKTRESRLRLTFPRCGLWVN